MWIRWNVIVCETSFCENNLANFPVSWVFQNYLNFAPMLESRNVDHVKSNCSLDMFLWKTSGRIHIFISFSNIFQLCTHARITKYGSREKYLFVRHVFVKRIRRTSQFHQFLKIISTLYPRQNHEMYITWQSIVRETCFCEKILAYFIVSRGFQKYFKFVPLLESNIFQLCTHARITKCGSW